jgi:uncharacterized membrane protein
MTFITDCVVRTTSPVASRPQKLPVRLIVPVVVFVAIAMRLYHLNGQFDYDGYDEGVYWQTLRAMSAGYSLYGQIFCSQPPAFPLSIYPLYILLGSPRRRRSFVARPGWRVPDG